MTNKAKIYQYIVTEKGNVYSKNTNWRGYGVRKMTQSLNASGYLSVRIIVDGKRKRIATHRLVAGKFLPPRPSPSHEIRHLDGNKLNNHYTNLAWGTRKENAEDRERHGRTSKGKKHSNIIKQAIAKAKGLT